MNSTTGGPQHFYFRRSDQQSQLLTTLFKMLEDETMVDCNLIAEGKMIKAHKVILSASSEYFRLAMSSFNNPCQNTAIILKDIPHNDLKLIVDFIYRGEVIVEQKQLSSLIRSADYLKIDGLLSKTVKDTPKVYQAFQSQTFIFHPQGDGSKAVGQQGNQSQQGTSILEQVNKSSTPTTAVTQNSSDNDNMSAKLPVKRRYVYDNCSTTNQVTRSGKQRSDKYDCSSSEEIEIDIKKLKEERASSRRRKQLLVKLKDTGNSTDDGNDAVNEGHNDESNVIDEENINASIECEYSNDSNDEEIKIVDSAYMNQNIPEANNGANHEVVPISVQIPSSVSSATARAIAASTTWAVASGLLGNPDMESHDAAEPVESGQTARTASPTYVRVEKESHLVNALPIKRGRGRPPRYSQEGDDTKSHMGSHSLLRAILPASTSIQTKYIHHPSAPAKANFLPITDRRSTTSVRGRKPKDGLYRDVRGKNKCPHCPQVYYSTQAMNDHINNVHVRNAQKHICKLCSKEFSWKISLNKHLRKIHQQEPDLDPSNGSGSS